MSIDMSTPAQLAHVLSGAINSGQAGVEIGTSGNAYDVYTNTLNAAGGILATTPFGAPLNAAAAANGSLAMYQKWSDGTLQPSDILGLTGTALTLALAAAALVGAPVTAGALALAFGVFLVAGWPLKQPFNDLARELADAISGEKIPGINSPPADGADPAWARPLTSSYDPQSWDDWLPNGIGETCNRNYQQARAWRQPVDPLMLDLDGDGLELKRADGSILFDHNADTIKTGTGWLGADDGILVRDLDANGTIDSGRELFGIDTLKADGKNALNGFDALADLDWDRP